MLATSTTVQLLVCGVLLACCAVALAKDAAGKEVGYSKEKDMMRKSIVYDKKTPHVFYCPMAKPTGMDKLIVKSRPLSKLCEHEGQPLPADYKSDCFQDLDESPYACKEKYRIMMRMQPPGSDEPYNGTRLQRFLDLDKVEIGEMIARMQSAPVAPASNQV